MSPESENITPNAHTYIAGEDEGRLSSAAKYLGLKRDEGRLPKKTWGDFLLRDDTLTAAYMHSVGSLGQDERVDQYGTLHLLSIRRKERIPQKLQYEELTDLFTKPTSTPEKPLEVEQGGDDEEEEGEDEVIDMVEGGSLGAAAFGIVKGTVGPGVLYLPRGMYSSGYGVAVPAMIFATVMYIYSAYRLLECWKVESDRNHKVQTKMKEVQALLQQSSLQDQYGTAEVEEDQFFTTPLLSYPELAERGLGVYSIVVRMGIALFQFGVCITYLIFVPQNLYECTQAIFHVQIPKIYFLLAVIAIEIPFSLIRDIRKLTPINIIASFLIAFGLLSVLSIAFMQGIAMGDEHMVFVENLSTMPAFTDVWYLFIGTSFFMMEGCITLVVPLQEAVYQPEDKKRFPHVIRMVTSWIVLFYIIFSLVCCAAFGSEMQTALTASLNGTLATAVQLAYSIAVIFTYPLQAFPAMEVAIQMLDSTSAKSSSYRWRRNVFTTLITLFLGVLAVTAIDYLGNVVSILGSLFGIPLALVFPPMMHNNLVKDISATTRRMNYGVIVIGFFAMSAASYNTIVTWDQGAETS